MTTQPTSKRHVYRAPDGELFRIVDIRRDGTVIADSGREFAPDEFNQCERVTG